MFLQLFLLFISLSLLSLFSHSVMSDSLWPHRLQHTRLPCPSPSPRTCLNSGPLSRWCHSNILSSVIPFSFCLQSYPVLGSFPMSHLFTSGGQSIGASASSISPSNEYSGLFSFEIDWFDLLTVWGTLKSFLQHHNLKELSRVFSSTTIQKHQFFGSHPYGSNLTSLHDYWRNHISDSMDLCWQSDVSAFPICCLGLSWLSFQGANVF